MTWVHRRAGTFGAGLGALIAASSVAWFAVKWLGVGYVLWLGAAQWRTRAAAPAPDGAAGSSATRTLVLRGWALNSLNPKGTLFMLAVVPQFIDTARPLLPQYLLICATLAATELVVNAAYTALAARMPTRLRRPHRQRGIHRVFRALLIGLAAFRRGS